MKKYTKQELKDILELHRKWRNDESGGKRANLRDANLLGADLSDANLRDANLLGANLRDANLRGANLRDADLLGANLSDTNLRGANLSGADLSDANLLGANLRGADLRGANLSGADLSDIKQDFFERISLAKNEAAGLYDYLMRGKVNGSSYQGECACFVGTIANITKEDYRHLTNGLKPASDSPTERWFLGIGKGDVPSSNQISKITCEWIEEFCKSEGIKLPRYELVAVFE